MGSNSRLADLEADTLSTSTLYIVWIYKKKKH